MGPERNNKKKTLMTQLVNLFLATKPEIYSVIFCVCGEKKRRLSVHFNHLSVCSSSVIT